MDRPNIVFIICHDLGAHLGCYGIRSVDSPNVDRLSERSVRFENYFCTAPQCSPSRASIATGRYPHSNGMFGLAHPPFLWRLNPGEKHVASILGENGYRTALAGVQHVTTHPEELGFHRLDTRPNVCEPIAARAVEFLDELNAHGDPFYLEIGFVEPHRVFSHGGAVPFAENGIHIPPHLIDTPGVREDLAAFQGAIRKVDAAIGTILDAVEASPLAARTLVVFTSDHGIPFPRAKCSLYDPGLETTLIVHAPWLAARGTTRGELLSNVDMMPTLLDATGVDIHEGVQGRSFWPLLAGGEYRTREEIFAEKTFHGTYDPMRCIRTPRYKYIRNFECTHAVELAADVAQSPSARDMIHICVGRKHPPAELYDLEADPAEANNLAEDDALRDVRHGLEKRLFDWMRQTGDALLEGPVPSPYYGTSIRELSLG